MATVLYSACFGRYDRVPPLPGSTDNLDRLIFTDDPELVAPGWKIQVAHRVPGEHPRMAAKRYKLLPHRYLPGFDARVWIDASHVVLDITGAAEAVAQVPRTGLALFAHPDRDDVYDEAQASMAMEKYAGQPIAMQVASYRRGGHPRHWGLWAAGTIASDHRADVLLEHWWSEVLTWSWQDQLSLPVVCRRMGIRPGTFGDNQLTSPWWRPGGHLRED